MNNMLDLNKVRVGPLLGGVIALMLAIFLLFSLFVDVETNEVVVVKYPTGSLQCYTEAGPQLQLFGNVTRYPRRGTIDFSEIGTKEQPGNAKTIRFNDGGHGQLAGSVQYEMPLDCTSIFKIHRAFGSQAGVESNAIGKMVDNAIYFAGPLMSSTESAGERRAELVQIVSDQAINGIYQTVIESVKKPDPITGEEKEFNIVRIVRDTSNTAKRQQGSILGEFGIKLLPIGVKNIAYEDSVEKQIKERQQAITAVQTSVANARRAEQDAITTEQQGKADAAKAKWIQETANATVIAKAEADKKAAELAAETAAAVKRKLILEGEGEGAKRQLIMNADGGLDKKLETYKEVSWKYAEAIQNAQPGAWTPTVVMGGNGGNANGGATALVDMLTAKAAKDIGIDLQASGRDKTSRK
ncbi:MAG: hypothetical protein KA802_11415 [Saprospiraceae bacterium]|nr:hypothetical protein [Saprospiraceae bacterium]